jgi:putative flippase GtrA
MIDNCIRYIRKNFEFIYRFLIVGVLTFIINFSLVFLMDKLFNLNYKLSISIAYLLTLIVHFMLNRSFTFKIYHFDSSHLIKYSVLPIINFFISLLTAIFVVEFLNMPPYLSVFFSTSISAGISYTFMKYFVFLKS